MTRGHEQTGMPIRPWYGPMEDPACAQGIPQPSLTPQKPEFPWLKKDVAPATAADDDPTIQWGDWSGKTEYDESAALDEDELRAAVGLPIVNLGS